MATGYLGYWGYIGGTGPGLSAGFLHGGILGSLCVISVIFSFCFFCFIFVWSFFCFQFHCYPHQLCRCFVFPIQLKADSRKNFIMKLNRCQFIRLVTRQYLELSAISVYPLSVSLAYYQGSLAGPDDRRPRKFADTCCAFFTTCSLLFPFLPAHFFHRFPQCLPASFAATNR